MSRFAFLISLGVSSRSVADWKRNWNRCLIVSLSVRSTCSSLISRISRAFMGTSLSRKRPLDAGPPGDETTAERHLVRHAGQHVAGRRLGQAAHLEQHLARPD